MTDLEITRRCAVAMGYRDDFYVDGLNIMFRNGRLYDPLYYDAQAMGLMKRFPWETTEALRKQLKSVQVFDPNRAICECVANRQTL